MRYTTSVSPTLDTCFTRLSSISLICFCTLKVLVFFLLISSINRQIRPYSICLICSAISENKINEDQESRPRLRHICMQHK